MTTVWNVNAREFTPMCVVVATDVGQEIFDLISESGVCGVQISKLPGKYLSKYKVPLSLSNVNFSDLSSLIASRDDLVISGDKFPKSLSHAMELAGFVGMDEVPVVDEVDEPTDVLIGFDADKFVRAAYFTTYIAELRDFKNGIVSVVYNFCLKNGGSGGKLCGLALSLFAAEWDRYHASRHEYNFDLKSLRERFGALKLMPFLLAIPELDVVGIHPEVRVRIKKMHFGKPPIGYVSSPKARFIPQTPSPDISTNDGHSAPPSTSRRAAARNISLNSELFGNASATETEDSSAVQTRVVLEQMLVETQGQILALLSQVPSDPLSAAGAVEQINQHQVLVNALKAALAVLPDHSSPPATAKATTTPLNVSKVSSTGRQKISLDAMLNFGESAPSTPLSAAAGAGENVGPLLADLSRILFAQVLQQKSAAAPPKSMIDETNAALERTLAEIVSAASSPPSSPMGDSSSIVNGRLIIPKSLPTSPILMSSSPRDSGHNNEAMDQLLRGLMSAPPPGLLAPKTAVVVPTVTSVHTKNKLYEKGTLLSIRKQMMTELIAVPKELQGLSCKQALPRTRPLN